MAASQPDRRKAQLAKIHLLAKQAGLDDEAYRAVLEQVAGVRSARELDAAGRAAVLDRLSRNVPKNAFPRRPHTTDDRPQLRKIEALLAEAKRPWSYADALAKRMHKIERIQWCTDAQLSAVIAALMKDAQRHGRKTS